MLYVSWGEADKCCQVGLFCSRGYFVPQYKCSVSGWQQINGCCCVLSSKPEHAQWLISKYFKVLSMADTVEESTCNAALKKWKACTLYRHHFCTMRKIKDIKFLVNLKHSQSVSQKIPDQVTFCTCFCFLKQLQHNDFTYNYTDSTSCEWNRQW